MPSKSSWSPARLKKFRATLAAKTAVTTIPIDLLPERPVRKASPKPSQEQAKLQLAHEVLQVLMKVLS